MMLVIVTCRDGRVIVYSDVQRIETEDDTLVLQDAKGVSLLIFPTDDIAKVEIVGFVRRDVDDPRVTA